MAQIFRKFDSSIGPMLDDGARIMFLVFSSAAILLCLAYQFLVVPYRYSMDYGEAPLVDQAMRLAAGQNIYRAELTSAPYTISNYPPLYIAVIALSVKLFGPAASFAVGRLISALCAWWVGICLMFIIYTVTKDRSAGLISGAVFIAFPFVTFWSPLLRIDMFALALSMSGLSLLVTQPVSKLRFLSAALLLVAAIFTRQSYALAAPLAAFVWLLDKDWRRAFSLAAIVGGVTFILFILLNMLTQGGFFYNIVTANVNDFGLDRLKYNWDRLLEAALVPLILGGFSLFLVRRWNPLWMLAAPYLIGASLSAATIGKIGSNVNYLLELCAALSLAAGVVVAWSRARVNIYSLRAALLIALALGIGQMIHITLKDYTGDLRDRRTSFEEISRLETFVKDTPGPILADEYMGMLTLQGRPLSIQPFEVTQLALAGKWDQTPLIDGINKKEFSAVIVYDKPWAKERWTQEMLGAVNRSYMLSDNIAGNKIYTPVNIKKAATAPALGACPGAAWQLPGDGSRGVQWRDGGLDFFGQGQQGQIPVYAVADGLLTRQAGWVDAVVILQDDPLHPGAKIWTYYGDMGAVNGTDSYVAQGFPPGTTSMPVKAGQLIGYQGPWSGKIQWPTWVHVHFAVISAAGQGAFPATLSPADFIDPTSYLNLALRSQAENKNQQELRCNQP